MKRVTACAMLFALAFGTSAAGADATANKASLQPPPDLKQRVGFDQKLGIRVPRALKFRESDGNQVALGKLLDHAPVVLMLGYYTCPNLCDTTYGGLARAVRDTGLVPGKDMQVILVSIDPNETPAIAASKQHMLAHMHPEAGIGNWHFLTASAENSRALATAVGFRYFYDKRNRQYDHAAGIVVLTPQGRTTRYLFGVQFPARTLRLSLVDASTGKIGSAVDKLLLLCCGYNPTTGQYNLIIGKLMRVLGIGFAFLLGIFVLALWLRQRKQEAQA